MNNSCLKKTTDFGKGWCAVKPTFWNDRILLTMLITFNISYSICFQVNTESQEIMYRLPMPDMNEITLGFSSGIPQIQITSTCDGSGKPLTSNDVTNISEQPISVKKMTSTPFHFASNAYSQPDFANMSTISGTTCASTENTIMVEQQAVKQNWEISNKTAGLRWVGFLVYSLYQINCPHKLCLTF